MTCSVAGCERAATLAGRCNRCYQRDRRARPTDEVVRPEKRRLVDELKALDAYDLARWCELRLAQELPGIVVRPERRAA